MRLHGLKSIFCLIALTAFLFLGVGPNPTSSQPGDLPIFPEAQGFGINTPAGRGGKILKVTNLNENGRGSLRAAIKVKGPRIIVFEVSGNIILTENLVIESPFITIAGQTAPSPGITLRGAGIQINTHDVFIQHLRIRVGDGVDGPEPRSRDGCVVYGPSGYNVVLDHMSISWAVDKNTSTWANGVKNVTISNSIISEALKDSIHPEGSHSSGSLIGDHGKNISMVKNLFAHNQYRNPAMKGGTTSVVSNNLIYNAGYWFMYIADDFDNGPSLTSIVGNVFIRGPDTPNKAKALVVQSDVKPGTKIYLSDNQYPGTLFTNHADFDPRVSSPPVWSPSLVFWERDRIISKVLASAGARPADRDSVDKRIVQEVKTRTGKIIDSQKEVGGWPDLAEHVWRIKVPTRPNDDDDGDGYTNIEEFLQQMSAAVETK